VAQKDSRVTLEIAKAAKRDSSSMTALSILGIIFLPAMLIAVCIDVNRCLLAPWTIEEWAS